MSNNQNNRKIAKNTTILYVRQLFALIVSLYTAGIVLRILGVENYGIYNVVGGIVSLFSFINGAMASSTQRFLNFEMGCNNKEKISQVFSMSMSIHILIAIIIFFLAETIGLWFLNYKLVIPVDKLFAANLVYQLSVVSAVILITQTPYAASIIAHERMSIYGYVGVIEVVLRVLLLYFLIIIPFDKLVLYAGLVFIVSFGIAIFYRIYCIRNFAECQYHYFWDKDLFKKLASFSGWNLFGSLVSVGNNQGQNILLNLFFGPIVNAARGIAISVNGAINQFVGSFMTATKPQITKCYASNDFHNFNLLIFRSAKFSFLLLLLLSIPVLIEMQYILELWLKTPPEFSVIFCQLTIINTLIVCVSSPLMAAAQASGQLKKYIGGLAPITLLNFPLLYLFLKLGYNPVIAYVINIVIDFVAFFLRLHLISKIINISVIEFIKTVFLRCWLLFIVLIVPLYYFVNCFEPSFVRLILSSFISIFITCLMILVFGLTSGERKFVMNIVRVRVDKLVTRIKK